MKTKSISKNYMYNLSYQILAMIIPLITTPYVSRILGASNIGIYSYTLSITTYFILFGSLGVSLYGQREIAYLQKDKTLRSKTFFEILLMRFITLGIALIFFYFAFCINGEYILYYKILILEIIANSLDISWFFQGIEEFKKTVVRNTIVKIISVISIFTFVKTSDDLNKYLIVYVASNLFGNISLWFYLPKYIEKISIKQIEILKHLKPTMSLFIPQIAVQLYTVLDKTMIGIIAVDKAEVGYYEQAQKIIKMLLTIATSFGTVMVPRMANTFAMGDSKKLREYMTRSFRFISMITFPLMFGIISVAKKFVPIFYGDGYSKVTYLINIISPILIAIGFSNVIGTQYLLPTKQQKKFTISVTIGAIVNFLLNIVCIKLWRSIGASIATVIAEFTVTAVQFNLIKSEIDIKNIFASCINYFFAALIMFVLSWFIGLFINNGVISIIIQVFFGGITYVAVLLIRKETLIYQFIEKFKLHGRKKNEAR